MQLGLPRSGGAKVTHSSCTKALIRYRESRVLTASTYGRRLRRRREYRALSFGLSTCIFQLAALPGLRGRGISAVADLVAQIVGPAAVKGIDVVEILMQALGEAGGDDAWKFS